MRYGSRGHISLLNPHLSNVIHAVSSVQGVGECPVTVCGRLLRGQSGRCAS